MKSRLYNYVISNKMTVPHNIELSQGKSIIILRDILTCHVNYFNLCKIELRFIQPGNLNKLFKTKVSELDCNCIRKKINCYPPKKFKQIIL